MPEMVLNRNYDLRSTAGRVINFEKGKPVYVPPDCVKEALQIGAEGVDEKLNFLDPETNPPLELTLGERKDLMLEAFPELEALNKREDFTAQGVPHISALKDILGFEPTSTERDDAWIEYLQKKSDES